MDFRPTLLLLSLLLWTLPALAQDTPTMESPVAATPADVRMDGYAQRQALLDRSLVKNVPLKNIGPTVMSGRVVDVDVSPDDPTHFYVAYASGGLWKTTNNGRSFTPLFDEEASMTLGDIAVDWDDGETIWVGTGENNSSRSSYAGTGVYTSTDGGDTWTHVGLEATQRTGRILIHPEDPNTVWVAALGPLYSRSDAGALYKTTDGGTTWTPSLGIDNRTGVIDLVMDLNDPEVLYAATWTRERRAWNFVEAGTGSGIHKSTDGGETWTRVSTEDSGFPTGEHVGRIGLALHADSGTLYAYLDNQKRRPKDDAEQPALTKDQLREMDRETFLALDESDVADYLERNNFPETYTAQSVLEMVREEDIEPVALVAYLEDANAQLFDTPVVGPQVFVSTDAGTSWTKTHDAYIDDLFYSYGYYFGEIRVAPYDKDRIYILGVPMLTSTDGGATFAPIRSGNLHVDHHALWINPNRPGHLINGNDGGINISYDHGETWFKANTPPVGQFYAVQVDQSEPYNVYGGLQDNGVWSGPSTYDFSYEWYAEGDYPYDRVMGGDGMKIEVDTRTNDIVYTGFQFGNYFRIHSSTGEYTQIQPQHELGERPYRFNWMTPIHLSRHNQDILYLGSQYLHRSLDRGDTWTKISPDLTAGGRPGDVPYGTLTTIDESPFAFGTIYVGTDDGRIHVTRDGGSSWTRIDKTLPQNLWVSRVDASHHAEGRVYVSLNGYRYDHFGAYVYRSDDYGKTWTRLGTDLPNEPVNVVMEDPLMEDLLYVGTDHGLYVSLDRGATFMRMEGGMPDAPVHDVKMQADAKDLVVGTHGRSIFVADVEHIHALPDVRETPIHLFAADSLRYDPDWGTQGAVWMDPETPSVTLPYATQEAGETTFTVSTDDGQTLATFTHTADAGLNYADYDLSIDADALDAFNATRGDEADPVESSENGVAYLPPGRYTVETSVGGETATGTLTVRPERASVRAEPRMENGVPGPNEAHETK